MIKFYNIASRQQGKSNANIALIKFCLATNKSLLIGTSAPKETIEDLRQHFPDALFLITDRGVQIKVRK